MGRRVHDPPRWLLGAIIYVLQLAVFGVCYWLLGIICRAWNLPFWGIFWVLTLFEAALAIDKLFAKLREWLR